MILNRSYKINLFFGEKNVIRQLVYAMLNKHTAVKSSMDYSSTLLSFNISNMKYEISKIKVKIM